MTKSSRLSWLGAIAGLACGAIFWTVLAVTVHAQQPVPGSQVITAPTGKEYLGIVSNTVQAVIGLNTVQAYATEGIGTPTIASGACGATTNGALASGATNRTGQVQIGSATTTTCTISFSATLAAAPKACVLFPANATAAATGTTVAYVSAITTAHFVITGSALASANYYYQCL